MGCRGLWNLHINGTWYRWCHPRGRISPPDDEFTWRTIRQLHDKPNNLEGWEIVPFPSPIHSNLDYVYTVDQDAGTFTISLWNEVLAPATVWIDLAKIYESSNILKHSFQQSQYSSNNSISETKVTQFQSLVSEILEIDFGIPTSMNEVQERFFTDFVFLWRFYVDDPLTWRYDSPVFNVLCIAFLRLAACDFEVSFDSNVEVPISFASIPAWNYPKADIYWFHGYLIVLQEDVDSGAMIDRAVLKAKSYINDSQFVHQDTRLILIPPHHVTFVELSNNTALSSGSLVLLANSSATQCSPGFRALARILTSDCWKKPPILGERWQFTVPPEVFRMILCELDPRDAVAFAQASFAAEQYYYSLVPQLKDVKVQNFKSSISCCGKRGGLEQNGICCSKCYSWQHLECVGLENGLSYNRYVCTDCQGNRNCIVLEPGGINRVSRRKTREGCQIEIRGSAKSLQLRLSKPSHLRPELKFLGNLVSIPPALIDYTILFNGSFSGLAYGLEDRA
ncbi:hypothetical protein BDV32DRAFT_158143 [Aspergillus pseudonomiae]|nr:hypothetical protein BDV32DRAFT_158143 [Aspergillus pseudonomiae]